MSQQITTTDPKSHKTYEITNFKPSEDSQKLSYTSARTCIPNYNTYINNQYKVFGYFSDWCQYDGRLDDNFEPSNAGPGRDLMNLNARSYDKIILGFCGIYGDNGEKKTSINSGAEGFQRKKWQPTFTDPWGDVLSYRNVGFTSWIGDDSMALFNQAKSQGILGGLRKLKEFNPDLSLSLSIGGSAMSEGFHYMAKDSTKRNSFIDGIIDILIRFPMFNSLDFAWEYPCIAGNSSNAYDENDGKNYAALIKELKSSLSRINRNDVLISIAAIGNVEGLKRADISRLIEAGVDSINLMTYDYFGEPWATELGHHTNISHYPSVNNWSIEAAVDCLEDMGIDLKRVFIGYAAYSRNAANATITSISPLRGKYSQTPTTVGTFESGSTEYYDIHYNYLDLNSKLGKNGFQLYTDKVANADFLFNQNTGVFMSIDTPRTVKEKSEYVVKKGLGGMFTWAIDMDHGILVNACREGFGCELINKVIDMKDYYFQGKTEFR